MEYNFENLGPDKFQEFCQALLAREYPSAQCFPVGQADGGRDALVRLPGSPTTAFQVKFVRNAMLERNQHQWLASILADEAPKIAQLAARGVTRYIVITNVRGTAGLDVGSMDQASAAMSSLAAGIETQCWWRDDVSRRLDAHPQLRWTYPELLSGADVLKSYIDAFMSEGKERRLAAIKAFLRDQYTTDRQVRFRQVEIQNNLLDLFVDVPMGAPISPNPRHQDLVNGAFATIAAEFPAREIGSREFYTMHEFSADHVFAAHRGDPRSVPAASFFLHPVAQAQVPFAVLEGAPGQGKSTITQYLCQVHRMRLLGDSNSILRIPSHHRAAPLRIPFRIDLRDFATWLGRRDPFAPSDSDTQPPQWQRSLESFMAAQVRHHSGGLEFDVADLHAVARGSAILLVCDGLDEIADISRRKEVIDEIVRGVNRLDTTAVSVQAVVTSRPVAFANAPAFLDERFPHFHLTSLTRAIIDEYCDKWLAARNVQPRDQVAVKDILRDKLSQPHLRDLARNPMQLAILLTLVQQRGASLPDKRTALYDSYIELFFNREAEKSAVVRDHRELLIDIHRYLAWTLHTAAEQGQSSGSITDERLRALLREYLDREGRDIGLVEALFSGLVERVVALVSRVQGTFEFEVQPLREYFAARFLYETAPYSPVGAERHGTKPDRFETIARNFYWLNVTRFYAGCYSKGELPSLVDGLRDLSRSSVYGDIAHPRALTATLLGDWVFFQHQRSVKEAVRVIVEGDGLRYLLSSFGRGEKSLQLSLPDGCGRQELADHCFQLLHSSVPTDYGTALCQVIQGNTPLEERIGRWRESVLAATGPGRFRWLEYGFWLDVLPFVRAPVLQTVLSDRPVSPGRARILANGGQSAFLQAQDETLAPLVDVILNEGGVFSQHRGSLAVIDTFAAVMSTITYGQVFQRGPSNVPFAYILTHNRASAPFVGTEGVPIPSESQFAGPVAHVIDVAMSEWARPVSEWRTSLRPWEQLIEETRRRFGDRWVLYEIACVAAGISAASETCTDASSLFDRSVSLCRRARYARLRSGQPTWWLDQLTRATDTSEKLFGMMLLFSWGSLATINRLLPEIEQFVENLQADEWHRLYWGIRRMRGHLKNKGRSVEGADTRTALPGLLSPRLCVVLALRVREPTSIYNRYLRDYSGTDSKVWSFCQTSAVNLAVVGSDNWDNVLPILRKAYSSGITFHPDAIRWRRGPNPIPAEAASAICRDPSAYSLEILFSAQAVRKTSIGEALQPVASVAAHESWFV